MAAVLVIALVVAAYVVVRVLDPARGDRPEPTAGGSRASTAPASTRSPSGQPSSGQPSSGRPPSVRPTSAAPAPGVPKRPANAQPMTVRYVYDGDTVSLQASEPGAYVDITKAVKVRLIGVDTPEMTPKKECFAQAATDHLAKTTPVGSRVWVAPDSDSWDNYGRRLFYLWTDAGVSVNHDLVAGGWGEPLRVFPNVAQWPLLKATGDRARAAKRGLWGSC